MAAGACGVGHDGTTPVETPNKLGITELVIEQTTEADAFVVAGWSGDEEVARERDTARKREMANA